MQVRVRILGEFAVEGLDQLCSRKARVLLKVLTVRHGKPTSVDFLAECIWGDRPPRHIAREISVLVSRLRQVLGAGRLLRGEAGYGFRPDWLDLDAAVEFAAAASRLCSQRQYGDAGAAAKRALELFRGPLLSDEPDADWAAAARLSAARLLVDIRHIAARAALAGGEPDNAASMAQAILDDDPYDEVALRTLMAAKAATGRRASAVAAYAEFRTRLADELGASPALETDAVNTAILKGAPIPGIDMGDRLASRSHVRRNGSRASPIDAVDEPGPAALTVRLAAALGPSLDLDVLMKILELPGMVLLQHLEHAARVGILDDSAPTIVFRNESVREALIRTTPTAWRSFMLRKAAMVTVPGPDRKPIPLPRAVQVEA